MSERDVVNPSMSERDVVNPTTSQPQVSVEITPASSNADSQGPGKLKLLDLDDQSSSAVLSTFTDSSGSAEKGNAIDSPTDSCYTYPSPSCCSDYRSAVALPEGYIPKRKGETPEERKIRKAWEAENLSTAKRKQLRHARREHKKAVRAYRDAQAAGSPEVIHKCKGQGAVVLASTPIESPLQEKAATPVPPDTPVLAVAAAIVPRDPPVVKPERNTEEAEPREQLPPPVEWSCFYFNRQSGCRVKLIQFVSWSRFDQGILLVITLNCITLALYDPLDEDCETDKCKVLSYFELAFNIIFILEMLIKMIALGVWGAGSYMDNSWNRLDFAIVCTSIADFIPGNNSSLSAFRAFRVLRPLRAINRFPNLRILVKLLLNTLPMLASVGVLCFLLFFVLGVLGVQLWEGVLQQRCVDPSTLLVFNEEASPYVCTQPVDLDDGSAQSGWAKCAPPGQGSYTSCTIDHGNPFWGSISFDHIYAAWISLFQVLTLEAWVDVMYLLQDSYSFHVWIYFFAVVILCSVFALNLVLVVISAHFGKTKSDDQEEAVQESGQFKEAHPHIASSTVVPEGHTPDEPLPPWRIKGRRLIESNWFLNSVMAAIVINMLFMASEHHGQSDLQTDISDWANAVLCWVFFSEMAIKLLILGVAEYFSDSFNSFDFIIVAVSLVEFFMAGGGGLSVLRTFRLIRAFKLIRFVQSLQLQLTVILRTLSDMVAFFILLLLFIFIFAILGMSLFGGKWDFDGEGAPRKNFDTFRWAMITVFQILTLEDWNLVMYDAVRGGGLATPLYFITLIILGNFIVLNLFVAILIGGFEECGRNTVGANEDISKYKLRLEHKYSLNVLDWCNTEEMVASVAAAEDTDEIVIGSEVAVQSNRDDVIVTGIVLHIVRVHDHNVYSVRLATGSEVQLEQDQIRKLAMNETNPRVAEWHCYCIPGGRDWALCCFTPDNCLRQGCRRLVSEIGFEVVIMVAILANSVCIAIERPNIGDDSSERKVLDILGHVFTGMFTLELFIKVIAHGLAFGPEPYLSSGWNRLDAFLVITSWVYIGVDLAGMGTSWVRVLRVFRMLRTLRPLRMINKAKKLRDTVNNLIESLLPLGSTLIIIVFIFLIFGILGMQFFSGLFYHCAGLSEEVLRSIDTKAECLAEGGGWDNQVYNFDNLGAAFVTLFVVATIDGWVEIMYLGIDVVGEDMQPKRNHSEGYVIFFVLFVMVGAFFSLNIFIGVVVENFQRSRRERAKKEFEVVDYSGDGGISREEFSEVFGEAATKKWFDAVDIDSSGLISREEFLKARINALDLGKSSQQVIDQCLQKKEVEQVPYDTLVEQHYKKMNPRGARARIFRLALSQKFEMVIMGAIGLNILMMAAEYYKQPDTLTDVATWLNLAFTVLFVVEAVIKWIALGLSLFWKDPWNVFDVFVVLVSILGSVFDLMGSDEIPINPTILRLLRILRVVRVLKVLRNARNLMILLGGVRGALPHVFNMTILMILLFFIFSAMGVELFGTILCDDTHPCDGMSQYANFENFGMGMLTLFRITTGDNWNGILKDCLRSSPDCDDSSDCSGLGANCCTPEYLTIPYFLGFSIFSQLILLNIIVALLMEELEGATLDIAREEAINTLEGSGKEEMKTDKDEPTHMPDGVEKIKADMDIGVDKPAKDDSGTGSVPSRLPSSKYIIPEKD